MMMMMMMKIITHFLLILLCSFISLTCSAEKCNPQDKKTLLKIKESFGNPYLLASWNPNSDCCKEWYQVECDRVVHRITSLTIFAGNLSGQIPPEVGDLPYLQILEFHKLTNVTGSIQPAIAKLKHLRYLRLSWLNLTGAVPSFLGQLKNLTILDLSFNSLSGSIPASLSKLNNLLGMHLDRNKLTGTIPDSFGTFEGIVPELHLSHNELSGKIPTSLGKMDFNTIDFSRNKLEGDASMLFGSNKTTFKVDLSRNLLEFDLSKVVFPKGLAILYLNHNKLYGNIPPQLTQLELQFLNVSYNRLCGQIPRDGKLQTFDMYSYFHNRCLCGAPLDSCK